LLTENTLTATVVRPALKASGDWTLPMLIRQVSPSPAANGTGLGSP
jgi:hypothetical protein